MNGKEDAKRAPSSPQCERAPRRNGEVASTQLDSSQGSQSVPAMMLQKTLVLGFAANAVLHAIKHKARYRDLFPTEASWNSWQKDDARAKQYRKPTDLQPRLKKGYSRLAFKLKI